MKKTIPIIILILIILGTLNNVIALNIKDSNVTNNNIIFRDDFDTESDYWYWRGTFTAYHTFENGVVNFKIPKADRSGFHVSEIWDNHSTPQYRYNNMKARIKVDGIRRGSRGWGFWNSDINPFNCSVAWFMSIKGSNPLYPLKGFWVICTNGVLGGFTFKRLRGIDISKWHDYEINWKEDSVDFYIDGENVAHITRGVPQTSCRIHVWVDNMKWLLIPVLQRICFPTTLSVDYLEITE